jgi:hypothetical protein
MRALLFLGAPDTEMDTGNLKIHINPEEEEK